MEIFSVKNLSFTYPQCSVPAVKNVSFTVGEGEFILLCGESGCGKTTLLRALKKELSPVGEKSGEVLFYGRDINTLTPAESARGAGFVMQNPENQTVTDKVWHELAFGLENLGENQNVIRRSVAETASFFGITEWFNQKTALLSGGQKQTLNLASVMVMQPKALILDEPTSQLDPIAAVGFFALLKRLNTELGTTIIISEHRMEEVFPLADRVFCMDAGQIICNQPPKKVAQSLFAADNGKSILEGLPAAMRIFSLLQKNGESPVSVKEGRAFVTQNYKNTHKEYTTPAPTLSENTAINLKNVWFRYQKDLPDVLCGMNLQVKQGEIYALLGANGSGKTTMLSCIAGLKRPYRGKLEINGKKIGEYKNNSLYNGVLSYLPQSPQTLFCSQSVKEELDNSLQNLGIKGEEREKKMNEVIGFTDIHKLLSTHPYDLSGGEQQKCALAKVLLSSPQILLLDEPTKGLDAAYKNTLGKLLKKLKNEGKTVLVVTHDIEFAAVWADTCALFFGGEVFDAAPPAQFFTGLRYYTTAAARIADGHYTGAVTAEAVAEMCRLNGEI